MIKEFGKRIIFQCIVGQSKMPYKAGRPEPGWFSEKLNRKNGHGEIEGEIKTFFEVLALKMSYLN